MLNRPSSPPRPSTGTSVASSVGASPYGHPDHQLSAMVGGAVRRKPARRANTAERRATHNAVERQRRETLNGRFLDLAALLPNLVSVRRPSKSAIVNSSIALIHTQRRLRAIAARELRLLSAEANALRGEVNEWRAAHPTSPVITASGDESATAHIEEPARSADFLALMELEDVTEEMEMNEAERIAYEMRGGDGGMMYGEDGEDGELGEDDYSDTPRQPQPAPQIIQQQQSPSQTLPPPPPTVSNRSRERGQSFAGRTPYQQQQQQQQPPMLAPHFSQPPQLTPAAVAAAHASLIPSAQYHHRNQQQQQQHAAQQQHQFPHQPELQYPQGPFILPPSFDTLAAVAAYPPPAALGEVDAAKLAAWNAHIYSALAAQQQHQQQQQQWAAAMQFQSPPNASQAQNAMFAPGATGGAVGQQLIAHFQRATNMQNMFGGGALGGMAEEDGRSSSSEGSNSPSHPFSAGGSYEAAHNGSPNAGSVSGASVSSSPSTSTSVSAPSLSLSISTANSNGSNTSLASPMHLNLGNDFASFAGAAYGPSGWSNASPATTPGLPLGPNAVTVGGGGGGHPNYTAMSMFI